MRWQKQEKTRRRESFEFELSIDGLNQLHLIVVSSVSFYIRWVWNGSRFTPMLNRHRHNQTHHQGPSQFTVRIDIIPLEPSQPCLNTRSMVWTWLAWRITLPHWRASYLQSPNALASLKRGTTWLPRAHEMDEGGLKMGIPCLGCYAGGVMT